MYAAQGRAVPAGQQSTGNLKKMFMVCSLISGGEPGYDESVDLHVFEQKGALILKWFHFYENGRIRLGVQTLGGPVNIAATAARRHLAAAAEPA